MLKMFVGNLPSDATEDEVRGLFSDHGTVRSVRLVTDVFTGRCRGFGFVEMEGHEARAAMTALNGRTFKGNNLRVNQEKPQAGRGGGRRR